MQSRIALSVAIRTPNTRSRSELVDALAQDNSFSLVDESEPHRDIEIIHYSLIRDMSARLPAMSKRVRIVVAFAPNDPAQLATLLASGVRGYHCTGEPWSQLLAVLRTVGDGGVRSDARTMNELLLIYRRMLQSVSSRIPNN